MLEESFECLSGEQCTAYLKKLKLESPETCNLEFLNLLIQRHLETIPFENLTPARYHEVVQIELEQIYKKIILKKRGGYCFEMNALFLGLLRGLGYDAYPIACRVLRRPGLRMPTHRASVVCLDGKKYFCDVGFGGIACVCAAQMDTQTTTETAFGKFIFEREYTGWLNLYHIPQQADQATANKILMVAENPSAPVDFEAANQAMCEKDSVFYNTVMIQKMTPFGPVSIDGDVFTFRGAQGKEVHKIESDAKLLKILKDVFAIELD